MAQNSHNFTNKRNHILLRNKKNRRKNLLSESSFAHFLNFNSFYLQEEHNVQLAKEVLAVESRIDAEEEEYESFRPPNNQKKVSKSYEKAVLDFIASQNINQNCQFSGGSPNKGALQGRFGQNNKKRSKSPGMKKCQQSSDLREKVNECQNKKEKVLRKRESRSLMILNRNHVKKDIMSASQSKTDQVQKQKKHQKERERVSLEVLKQTKKSPCKFIPQRLSQSYLNMSFTPDINFLRGKTTSKGNNILNNYGKNQQKERRSFSQTQSLTNKRNNSFSNQADKTENQQSHFRDNHMKPSVQNEQSVSSKNTMRSFMGNNAIFEKSRAWISIPKEQPAECAAYHMKSKQKQKLDDMSIVAVQKLSRQTKQIKALEVLSPILNQPTSSPEPIKL